MFMFFSLWVNFPFWLRSNEERRFFFFFWSKVEDRKLLMDDTSSVLIAWPVYIICWQSKKRQAELLSYGQNPP